VARQRDFKAEYAARIARGLAAGKSRSQARGHGAEKRGAVGATQPMPPRRAQAEILKLRDTRQVKVVLTYENGAKVQLFGKGGWQAAKIKEHLLTVEDMQEYAEGMGYEEGQVVSAQVIYS
jgi:hypothetical protein